ncbi:MAG: HU-CCDC81 and SPOR domain-containing protein [Ferruginibacter sp.]|nr:HU-CCDC81 and SPOR domain-containing protein [Cytophagales bacterium]
MKANYIKELLFEQDCVVIPEFGGFIANYVSAEIHSIRHTFTPPSKSIAFNEMLRLNDGLLASYASRKEGISREEALVNIRNFTRELREEIKQKNKYRLEEVGTLFLNHEQKLQFEPDNRVNFLNDSFGLPELLYKPVERGATQQNAALGNVLRNRVKDRSQRKATAFNWGAVARRSAKNPSANAQANQDERAGIGRPMPPDHGIGRPESTDRLATTREKADYYEDDGLIREGNPVRPSRLWLLVVVPLVLLLATTTGLFLFFDDGNNLLSSMNPFRTAYVARNPNRRSVAGNEAGEPAVVGPANPLPTDSFPTVDNPTQSAAGKESELPVAGEVGDTQPALENSTTGFGAVVAANAAPVDEDTSAGVAIATDIPRYYVVIGSFTRRKNAMVLRNKLVMKGVEESKLILPGPESKLHKVSHADFPTFQEAASTLGGVKNDYQNAWVFKHVR